MTREQLVEYRDLQQEIKRLNKRLENFKDLSQGKVADTVKGSSVEFPYTQHSIMIEGFDAERKNHNIAKLERILTTQINKSMDQTVGIAKYICSIEPVKVRTIFEYRYYDLMTWQQIAFKCGWTDESTPREIHDKYLKNINLPRITPKQS